MARELCQCRQSADGGNHYIPLHIIQIAIVVVFIIVIVVILDLPKKFMLELASYCFHTFPVLNFTMMFATSSTRQVAAYGFQ